MSIRIYRSRSIFCKTALLLGVLLSLTFPFHRVHAQAQTTQGSWSTLPYTMPINPIHCGVMHSGKVLVVAGSENEPSKNQQHISHGAVWDPQAGTINVQSLLWDVFCNGMACFPDGRFLIVGGSIQYDPFYGEPRTTIFRSRDREIQSGRKHGPWPLVCDRDGDRRREVDDLLGTQRVRQRQQCRRDLRRGFGMEPRIRCAVDSAVVSANAFVAQWKGLLFRGDDQLALLRSVHAGVDPERGAHRVHQQSLCRLVCPAPAAS